MSSRSTGRAGTTIVVNTAEYAFDIVQQFCTALTRTRWRQGYYNYAVTERVNMSIHVYVSQTAGIQPLLAALLVKLSRLRVDCERHRVQHATFTHYKHTQSHPCIASLPGIQRDWHARQTQRTLCSQTCLYMPQSGKVGKSRLGDVQAASL